jgi:hypothetical protein
MSCNQIHIQIIMFIRLHVGPVSRLNLFCGYGDNNATQDSTSKVHLEIVWNVSFIIIMTSMVGLKIVTGYEKVVSNEKLKVQNDGKY